MTAHQFRRILLITLNDFPLMNDPDETDETDDDFVLERSEELEGELRIYYFQRNQNRNKL